MMQRVTIEEIMEGEDDYDSDVLIGVPSIARYVGVEPHVVKRWIFHHGLPVFRLGPQDRGPWLAHVYAIDSWILQRKERRHGGSDLPEERLKPPQRLLIGLEEIGEYVGVSRWTIRRRAESSGFPIAKRPDGVYTTSARLVDLWLLAHIRARRRTAA